MRPLLRTAAIVSSLALLIGCVWFAQKQANPTMMPSSKDIAPLLAPERNASGPQTVMPGSKSGTVIMSGSKSWSGSTTVSSGVLKIDQTAPPAKP